MGEVALEFKLRDHQRRLLASQTRFSVWVCHRRLGKTSLAITALFKAALEHERLSPPPRFAYMAPLYKQAKSVAWDQMLRLAYQLPEDIRPVPNQAELRLDFPWGARIQLFGADNPHALRGIYLDGVVLDEYAQIKPSVWAEVIRPTLTDYQGWAIFLGTPMGHNHFYDLWEGAITLPWSRQMYKSSETGIIPADELALARASMSEEKFDQEFECSFEGALVGSYYGPLMVALEREGRMQSLVYDPMYPVHTGWDIGINDTTAIWAVQPIGSALNFLNYYEASGAGVDHYVKVLKEWGYVYGRHYLPHDVQVREWGNSGRSRLEMLESLLGSRNVVTVPKMAPADRIQAVRAYFTRFHFDPTACHDGILALKAYRRIWNEERSTWEDTPYHDWASNGADALGYFCVGWDGRTEPERKTRAEMAFDAFAVGVEQRRARTTFDW